jgi:alpha-tubulin suppressor-like RCC1 family protein
MRVALDEEVAAISCSDTYSLILSKRGDVFLIGTVEWVSDVVYTAPHKLETPSPIVAIATYPSRLLLLSKEGDVYLYGAEHKAIDIIHREPFKIVGLPPIVSLAVNSNAGFFIDAHGGVYTIGYHPFRKAGEIGASATPVKVPLSHPVLAITPGDEFTYFLTCDGLYLYEEKKFTKVDILITDMPLCRPTVTQQEQQRRMGCHQCGEQNQSLLGYHKETQRIFCNTGGCLGEYKQFRVL